MAVQTNPHAEVLCSQIIYAVAAIFGSGIFFVDCAVGDERDFGISINGMFFPLSALSEDGYSSQSSAQRANPV